jgi:putative ABC transport system ATP-binding protein
MTDTTPPDPSADPVVTVAQLGHRYVADPLLPPVLDRVGFELRRGELLILTGPSGSGKTTLLTLVGALRSIQQGSLRVLGQDVGSMTEAGRVALRRSIGFIFQDHHLFDELTARETLLLAMGLQSAKYSRQDFLARPQACMQRLGLGDKLESRPAQLSTGQRQRVAIARALINQPALILADEPTASLDAASAEIVMDMLGEVVESGERCGVLMISHDERHFSRAHRIVVLVDGRVAEIRPGGRSAT